MIRSPAQLEATARLKRLQFAALVAVGGTLGAAANIVGQAIVEAAHRAPVQAWRFDRIQSLVAAALATAATAGIVWVKTNLDAFGDQLAQAAADGFREAAEEVAGVRRRPPPMLAQKPGREAGTAPSPLRPTRISRPTPRLFPVGSSDDFPGN